MATKNTGKVPTISTSTSKGKPAAKTSKPFVNVGLGLTAPVAPVAPVATPAPALSPAEAYKAHVAREAATHASLTARPAPFCVRAGVGSRAWALDLALCDLHAAGAVINVQSLLAAAQKRLTAVGSPVIATPGSHFAAMIQRGYLARGVAGYALTEHGVKQAEACGALKPAAPAKGKAKGKK